MRIMGVMKAVTKPCIYLKLFPKKCSNFNVTVSTIAFTSNKSILKNISPFTIFMRKYKRYGCKIPVI